MKESPQIETGIEREIERVTEIGRGIGRATERGSGGGSETAIGTGTGSVTVIVSGTVTVTVTGAEMRRRVNETEDVTDRDRGDLLRWWCVMREGSRWCREDAAIN